MPATRLAKLGILETAHLEKWIVPSFDNTVPGFRFLPDAWDGALNPQRAFGNNRHFDVDPLLVTYSKIGMPGPDGGPSES